MLFSWCRKISCISKSCLNASQCRCVQDLPVMTNSQYLLPQNFHNKLAENQVEVPTVCFLISSCALMTSTYSKNQKLKKYSWKCCKKNKRTTTTKIKFSGLLTWYLRLCSHVRSESTLHTPTEPTHTGIFFRVNPGITPPMNRGRLICQGSFLLWALSSRVGCPSTVKRPRFPSRVTFIFGEKKHSYVSPKQNIYG